MRRIRPITEEQGTNLQKKKHHLHMNVGGIRLKTKNKNNGKDIFSQEI